MNGQIRLWHFALTVALAFLAAFAAYYQSLADVNARIAEVRETYATKRDLAEIRVDLEAMRDLLEAVRTEQAVQSVLLRQALPLATGAPR